MGKTTRQSKERLKAGFSFANIVSLYSQILYTVINLCIKHYCIETSKNHIWAWIQDVLGLGRNAVKLVTDLLTGTILWGGSFSLIGVAEDARCGKCGLEEKSFFHILCECNALAGIGQRVLNQVKGYPDAETTREAELGALMHFYWENKPQWRYKTLVIKCSV